MGAKLVGIQRISGEKGKKSGQPYDFCQCFLIDDSNPDVDGYESVSATVDTDDILKTNDMTFSDVLESLNCDVDLIYGRKFGKIVVVGFRFI